MSAANTWDADATPVKRPATDPATAYGPRHADGSLPATDFLVTGTPDIGASMR
ncbi:hypothetical protein [Streptomyces pratensis]|uniref:hypothetical protein n=1 Tax=Streptomyces pratensis TaxID=1169025 RepID=UPI0030180D4D